MNGNTRMLEATNDSELNVLMSGACSRHHIIIAVVVVVVDVASVFGV